MNKTLRKGLGVLVGLGVAAWALTNAGCGRTQIYDVHKGKQGCVQIEGCGTLCYGGFMPNGSRFLVTMNNERFVYSTEEKDMYPCGCQLEMRALSPDLLVVSKRGDSFFP